MSRTWIPVLVDSEDYDEITVMVAERAKNRGTPSVPELPAIAVPTQAGQTSVAAPSDPKAAAATEALAKHRAWDIEDLERLADPDSRFVTARRWTRAIDVCLDHVGDPFPFISTQQVCEESGMAINEWRDAPKKIPGHMAAHYPNERDLPLAWLEGRKVAGLDNQIYWALSPEQAKRWREVRGV